MSTGEEGDALRREQPSALEEVGCGVFVSPTAQVNRSVAVAPEPFAAAAWTKETKCHFYQNLICK